jgi:hypothetical protein
MLLSSSYHIGRHRQQVMEAVLATIVAGGRAQIRLNIEVNRNKLISILIY